jgi:hypothetical protein
LQLQTDLQHVQQPPQHISPLAPPPQPPQPLQPLRPAPLQKTWSESSLLPNRAGALRQRASLPRSIAKLSPAVIAESAAATLAHFFGELSPSLRIYLDDTCARHYGWDDSGWKTPSTDAFLRPRHGGDWTRAWNDSDAAVYGGQAAIHWPQKFGAAGFLPHMVRESPWVTDDFRRANLSLVVLFTRQAGPVTSVPAQCRRLLSRESEAWRATNGARHFFVLTDSRGPCCNDGVYKDVEFLENHIIGHHGERDFAPVFKHTPGPPLHCFQLDKDVTIPTPTLHQPTLRAATYLKELRRHGRAAQKQAALPNALAKRDVLIVAAGQHHGRDEFVNLHYNDTDMMVRKKLRQGDYYKYMTRSKYCAILPGFAYQTPRIAESLHLSCVPVFLTPNYSPPFDGTLDWSKFSVTVPPEKWADLKEILLAAPYEELFKNMQTVRDLYEFHLEGYSGDGVLPLIVYEMWRRVAQRAAVAGLGGAGGGGGAGSQASTATAGAGASSSVEVALHSGPDAGKQVSRDAKGVIRVSGAGGLNERWSCKTKKGLRDGALCSCGKPR